MIKKLIIVAGLAIYSLGAGAPPASLVNTAKVIKGEVNPLEEFIGTLSFSKTSALASETNGAVVSVNFEAGDNLRKGDLLLEVDSKVLDAQIESLRASVKISKINLLAASRLCFDGEPLNVNVIQSDDLPAYTDLLAATSKT